jgi:uncharacterized membrane protein YqjE
MVAHVARPPHAPHATHAGPGLLDTLQGIAATTMRAMQTRLQLAAVDLEAERDRLLQRMTFLLMALFFGAFGLLLGVLWIVMSVDEDYRTIALGAVALLFLLAGASSWWLMRSGAVAGKGFMSDTLEVLADDAQALTGKSITLSRSPGAGERTTLP